MSKVDTLGTASFNSVPNLLMQGLDREMQRNWTERTPNRRYARLLINMALTEHSGNFKGLMLEKMQPLAPSAFAKLDWSVVMTYPLFFYSVRQKAFACLTRFLQPHGRLTLQRSQPDSEHG